MLKFGLKLLFQRNVRGLFGNRAVVSLYQISHLVCSVECR